MPQFETITLEAVMRFCALDCLDSEFDEDRLRHVASCVYSIHGSVPLLDECTDRRCVCRLLLVWVG